MPKKQRERRRRGDGTLSVDKRDAGGKPILWKASISLGVVTIDGKARRNRPTEYAESEAEAHQKMYHAAVHPEPACAELVEGCRRTG